MTCREFIDVADSLSLREVLQAPNQEVVLHASECVSCEARLQERRMLAGAMQSLSLATAGREAGPAVEQAVLQAFRRRVASTTPPPNVRTLLPSALRLSRWFEAGAYIAVAAACLIAVLLGYRVWHHPAEMPLRVQSTPSITLPSQVDPPAARDASVAMNAGVEPVRAEGRKASSAKVLSGSAGPALTANTILTEEALAKAGYTDLMLCDPLSCSGDAQVVRMEVPAQGSPQQTVMADVVVGDDGLVRAIRIVN